MTIHSRSSGRAFYSGLLEALIEVMGSSVGYLFDHGPRVALLAPRLGQSLGLTREHRAELFFGRTGRSHEEAMPLQFLRATAPVGE